MASSCYAESICQINVMERYYIVALYANQMLKCWTHLHLNVLVNPPAEMKRVSVPMKYIL